MLRAKNNYRWPELVEKSSSDKVLRERLIAEPVEVLKENGVEISSNIEIVVLKSSFPSYSYPVVLPLQEDVDIVEPVDTWTQIVIKAWSDSNFKSDLVFNFKKIAEEYISYISDEDEADKQTKKLEHASVIQRFLGNTGNINYILSDLEEALWYDSSGLQLFQDSTFRKHFIISEPFFDSDIRFVGVKLIYLRSACYRVWP
jgi:hypothetical protein